MIFSTYVEVFLGTLDWSHEPLHFLHVCGGVSRDTWRDAEACKFSPRMWRCFWNSVVDTEEIAIFSTYVEVFLRSLATSYLRPDFLHVCGGVSLANQMRASGRQFSPRMWRCFLRPFIAAYAKSIFSTYVEVFPKGD